MRPIAVGDIVVVPNVHSIAWTVTEIEGETAVIESIPTGMRYHIRATTPQPISHVAP